MKQTLRSLIVRLCAVAVTALLVFGLGATTASAVEAPRIPKVIRATGTVTTSLYIQRNVVAGLPSAGADASEFAGEALGALICGLYFPEAGVACEGIAAVVAQHGLLMKLAEAKENNSCLRIRYPAPPRTSPLQPSSTRTTTRPTACVTCTARSELNGWTRAVGRACSGTH